MQDVNRLKLVEMYARRKSPEISTGRTEEDQQVAF